MFYKDTQTEYWWSKANGGNSAHYGPRYKVFKEGAKGLNWVFNELIFLT